VFGRRCSTSKYMPTTTTRVAVATVEARSAPDGRVEDRHFREREARKQAMYPTALKKLRIRISDPAVVLAHSMASAGPEMGSPIRPRPTPFRPARVIRSVATSIILPPARMRCAVAVASRRVQARPSARFMKPCTSMTASVQPSAPQPASSAIAR